MKDRRLDVLVERRGILRSRCGECDCGGDEGNEGCRCCVIFGDGSGRERRSSARISPKENMSIAEQNGNPNRT
jgi:hypothetical protein